MTCSTCPQPATIKVTWGLYEPAGKERAEPMNEELFCVECSDKLWKAAKPSVNAGLMHWTNQKINEPFSPPPTLSDLRDQVEKLKLLLDDPQPGLISWVQMYGERMKWINDFWNR